MTARARRDNLRQTWVPTGDALRALERDSGVVIRFIIGRTCAGLKELRLTTALPYEHSSLLDQALFEMRILRGGARLCLAIAGNNPHGFLA